MKIRVCIAIAAFVLSASSNLRAGDSASVLSDRTYISKVENFRGRPQVANSIEFVGDSIVDLGGWPEFFPGTPILNRGISGDTTVGLAARLDEIITRAPRSIFLMIGTNDLFFGAGPKAAAERLGAIVGRLRRELPSTQLFVHSILPTRRGVASPAPPEDGALDPRRVAEYNNLIAPIVISSGATWIDLTGFLSDPDGLLAARYTYDGIHLNAEGYRVWAKIIAARMVAP